MKIHIVKTEGNTNKLSAILFPQFLKIETGQEIPYNNLARSKHGKPLPINNTHFNISHSGNFWCIAFSNFPCGIDIEVPRPVHSKLANKILSTDEKIIKGNILNNWVIKEAYAKMLGKGLAMDFSQINPTIISRKFRITDLCTTSFVCYATSKEPVDSVTNWMWQNNILKPHS